MPEAFRRQLNLQKMSKSIIKFDEKEMEILTSKEMLEVNGGNNALRKLLKAIGIDLDGNCSCNGNCRC